MEPLRVAVLSVTMSQERNATWNGREILAGSLHGLRSVWATLGRTVRVAVARTGYGLDGTVLPASIESFRGWRRDRPSNQAWLNNSRIEGQYMRLVVTHTRLQSVYWSLTPIVSQVLRDWTTLLWDLALPLEDTSRLRLL